MVIVLEEDKGSNQIGCGNNWENKGTFGLTIFCFSFLLKIKSNNRNAFGWIFENIFSKNIFSNEPKTGNNKIAFSVFSIEIKNFVLGKMKTYFQYFYLLITEKVKRNIFLEL